MLRQLEVPAEEIESSEDSASPEGRPEAMGHPERREFRMKPKDEAAPTPATGSDSRAEIEPLLRERKALALAD